MAEVDLWIVEAIRISVKSGQKARCLEPNAEEDSITPLPVDTGGGRHSAAYGGVYGQTVGRTGSEHASGWKGFEVSA